MFLPVALVASALFVQQTPPASQAPAAPSAAVRLSTTPADTGPVANLPTVIVAATPAEPTQTCRTEAVTGSRFGRRVCRNNVESEDDRVNSREMLRRLQGARMPDGS